MITFYESNVQGQFDAHLLGGILVSSTIGVILPPASMADFGIAPNCSCSSKDRTDQEESIGLPANQRTSLIQLQLTFELCLQ